MRVYKHSTYKYVTVAEIPRSEIKRIDIDLCKQPTETVDKYYSRQKEKPDLITNAGFFDMGDGKTIFTLYNEGKIVHKEDWLTAGFGMCNEADVEYASTYDKPWRDFISGYPCLIGWGSKLDTSIAEALNYKARRTIWGYNDTTIFVVCIDSPGMAFTAMQNLCLSLGMKFAINLDGGGSTRMLYKGTRQTANVYNRPVDSVLAIYLKPTVSEEPSKQKLYRVQVGAFKSQINANSMRDTIRNLNDPQNIGYKNAYTRLVGELYKVQIGAYSVKANAERVLKDLKDRGISAFIVESEV